MSTNQNNGVTIISNENTNELYLLDGDSRQFQTITVQNSPQAITVSPVSNTVYVINPLDDSVSSVNYDYDNTEFVSIIENVILENDLASSELILQVVEGITQIPQNHEVDTNLISGLLKNIGVTGQFDGNEVARLLIDDYKTKKEFQPTTALVPTWTVDLAKMFVDDGETFVIPDKVNCNDDFVLSIRDLDNVNAFEVWVNILPICALT